jgi:hypothetical protein
MSRELEKRKASLCPTVKYNLVKRSESKFPESQQTSPYKR